MTRNLAASPLLVAFATVLAASPARAQHAASRRVDLDSTTITLEGKVETLLSTTSVPGERPTDFRLRRVYLGAVVRVDPLVSGKIQVDFAGEKASLKDAYVKLSFAPALQLLAGNAYRPFSRLALTSDTRMPPVERGVQIRGLEAMEEQDFVSALAYTERDVGFQLIGAPEAAPLGLRYAAGIFRGPVFDRVGGRNSFQYVARLSAVVLPRLQVGAAWSSRDFVGDTVADEPRALKRGDAYEVDAEYGAFGPGFHALGEVAAGAAQPFTATDFGGAAAWLAYRTRPLGAAVTGLEPTVRVGYGHLDAPLAGRGGTLVTPGLNLYLGARSRVMVNYDVWAAADGGEAGRSFKLMFELVF
ncbi:MAG TPA: porin [Longimicrobiaceae bacterium]|nr:porin [Longimicrobiaceae bacterium]